MKSELIRPLKAQLQLQTTLMINLLANISEEEACFQINENLNSIKWTAGHIVNTRISLLNILTDSGEDQEYSKIFGKGTSKNLGNTFPTLNEIMDKLNFVTNKLIDVFEKAENGFLLSKAPFQTSIPDDSILGLTAFIIQHEANHCGQISILRKFNSKIPEQEIILYDKIICN